MYGTVRATLHREACETHPIGIDPSRHFDLDVERLRQPSGRRLRIWHRAVMLGTSKVFPKLTVLLPWRGGTGTGNHEAKGAAPYSMFFSCYIANSQRKSDKPRLRSLVQLRRRNNSDRTARLQTTSGRAWRYSQDRRRIVLAFLYARSLAVVGNRAVILRVVGQDLALGQYLVAGPAANDAPERVQHRRYHVTSPARAFIRDRTYRVAATARRTLG